MSASGLDFEQSMNRLIAEANAGTEYVAVLRHAVEAQAATGRASAAGVADSFADLLTGLRRRQEGEPSRYDFWFPDVAALGDDSPHVTVIQGPSRGDLVWSWVSKGQRRWQQGTAPR